MPTQQDTLNETLVSKAALGKLDHVQRALTSGADVDAADQDGITALKFAALNGHLECVEALLQAGAAVNAADQDGTTALMCAALNGHEDCVKALIKAGADVHVDVVDVADGDGRTALKFAALNGHLECVEALLQAGAKADAGVDAVLEGGETALMFAALNGHLECVTALLQAGADVNAENAEGETALMCAAQEGHTACVEALIQAGAAVPEDLKDAHEHCKVLLNEAKKKQSWLLGIGLMIWGLLTSVVLSVPVVVANAKALTLSAVWSSVSTIMSQGVASLPMLAQTLGLGALIITGLIMVSGMVNVYQLKANQFDGVIKTIAASLMGVVGVSCVSLVGMQWINFNWMAHMTLTTLPMPVWVGLSITCVLVGLFAYSLRKCFIKSEGPTESEGSACDKTGDAQARQSIELEGSNRAKPALSDVRALGASDSRDLANRSPELKP